MKYFPIIILTDSSTKLGFANLVFANTRPYDVIIRSPSLGEPVRVAARSFVEKQVRQIAGNDKNDRRIEFSVSNTNGGKEFVNGYFGTIFVDVDDSNNSQDSKRKSLYIGQKSKCWSVFLTVLIFSPVLGNYIILVISTFMSINYSNKIGEPRTT